MAHEDPCLIGRISFELLAKMAVLNLFLIWDDCVAVNAINGNIRSFTRITRVLFKRTLRLKQLTYHIQTGRTLASTAQDET